MTFETSVCLQFSCSPVVSCSAQVIYSDLSWLIELKWCELLRRMTTHDYKTCTTNWWYHNQSFNPLYSTFQYWRHVFVPSFHRRRLKWGRALHITVTESGNLTHLLFPRLPFMMKNMFGPMKVPWLPIQFVQIWNRPPNLLKPLTNAQETVNLTSTFFYFQVSQGIHFQRCSIDDFVCERTNKIKIIPQNSSCLPFPLAYKSVRTRPCDSNCSPFHSRSPLAWYPPL